MSFTYTDVKCVKETGRWAGIQADTWIEPILVSIYERIYLIHSRPREYDGKLFKVCVRVWLLLLVLWTFRYFCVYCYVFFFCALHTIFVFLNGYACIYHIFDFIVSDWTSKNVRPYHRVNSQITNRNHIYNTWEKRYSTSVQNGYLYA